jgi:hypothetical protein
MNAQTTSQVRDISAKHENALNYRKPDAWQDRAYTPIYGS